MAFPCPYCKHQYSRIWSLNRHMRDCSTSGTLPESGYNNTILLDRGEKPLMPTSSRAVNRWEVSESSTEDDHSSDETGREERERDVEEEENEVDNCEEFENTSSGSNSETSADDEEDVEDMNEDDSREVRIRWRISSAYRVSYPWIYWGDLPKIKKHIRWIERLRDAENTTVMYNIRNASDSQIAALCEIAYNYVYGNIPDQHHNRRLIKKQRRAVRFLAQSNIEIQEKRKEILRRGASLVQSLIFSIEPLIIYDIPRSIEVVSEDDEEEGEEEEEEEEEMS